MNRIAKGFCTIVMTVVAVGAVNHIALAGRPIPPPKFPRGEVAPNGTLKFKPATVLKLGNVTVQLEKTTLSEIQREAKTGVIGHQGDASESIYWLCYTVTNDSDPPQRLWVLSSGETGGNNHSVTGVVAAQGVENGGPEQSCPSLPTRLRPINTDRGIWLGTTKGDLEKILGRPSETRGDILSFGYEGKLRGNYKRPGDKVEREVDWDEINRLTVRIKNDKVTFIWISKITSY